MAQNTFAQRRSSLEQFWQWRIDLYEKSDKAAVKALAQEIIDTEFLVEDNFSKDGIIAREISKTTWQSFCRFGDRKSASGALRLIWISNDNKGMPLDTQAIFISDNYSMDISADDLAIFIMEYDHGKSYFPAYQNLENLKKSFKNLVSFKWNHKFAKQVILKKVIDEGYF